MFFDAYIFLKDKIEKIRHIRNEDYNENSTTAL